MMKSILLLIFLVPLALFGQEDTTFSVSKIVFPAKIDQNVYFNIPDSNYQMYKLPSGDFKKTQKWKGKDERRSASNKGWSGYFSKNYPDSLHLISALAMLDSAKEFYQIRNAISWCIYHPEESFPYLIARLSDKRKIGLTNSADFIIWDRFETGDLVFYGHGGSTETGEDLFTVAGRASTALNEITGESFAIVHASLTDKQAQEFKQLWVEYLKKLK